MVSLDAGVRPTLNEFKEVFDTDPNRGGVPDAALKAYLNAAHDVVEDRLGGEGVTEGKLERMEKFLAAHLASAQDPRIKSHRIADTRTTYQRVEGGAGSDYWQIVVMLDPTGKLQGIQHGRADLQAFGPGRD